MVGSIFYSVGDSNEKIKVSELRPSGYENNEELWGGTYGDFQIKLLNANGGGEAQYDWEQDCDGDADSWYEGAWIGADDLEFSPGQGIWFYCGVWEEGKTYSLTCAGEPLMAARNVPLRDGHTGITIPLARAVEISEIKPDGYQDNEELWGGTYGDFQIKLLNANGGGAGQFDWEQDCDGDADSWYDGAWIGEHTFQPGDGIWVYCGVWEDGKTYTLNFPGFEDEPEND